jgi:hypothetical protein
MRCEEELWESKKGGALLLEDTHNMGVLKKGRVGRVSSRNIHK